LHFDGTNRGRHEAGVSLSATFTVWRLRYGQRSCRCLITSRDNRWRLIVWRDNRIALCEAHATDDLALLRAADVWRALMEHGWRDPLLEAESDVVTRRCPVCQQPTGDALIRVFHLRFSAEAASTDGLIAPVSPLKIAVMLSGTIATAALWRDSAGHRAA
jgi:hypothetical protein